MKHIISLIALLWTVYAYGASPVAPQFGGVTGQPNQGAWITNITWIYTNVAVKGPGIEFQNVTVYAGTNGLTGCVVLSWDNNTNEVISSSMVYYGDISLLQTNTFRVSPTVTSAAFFSVFSTNSTYWAYVTAWNATLESPPSNVILFRPNK